MPMTSFANESLVESPGKAAGMSWTTVEMEPQLPLPVYTSLEVWNPDRIRALAIYCSDGRWGAAFDEFCHKALHMPRYDRFAVPGGPAWFTRADVNRNGAYYVAREQLDFLVQVHALERIVLITHYGCAFYTEMLKRSPLEVLPTQLEEVQTAATTLRSWFPGIVAEAYLAMRRDNRLSFHAVNLP
jgi:hypothetical protein